MGIKICLLITDDADDQHAISEAISELSSDTVLLSVVNSHMALRLLKEHEGYTPDYLLLDVSMHGIRINSILNAIKNDKRYAHTPVVIYGNSEAHEPYRNDSSLLFFDKDYTYTELKNFLKDLFTYS